MTTILAVEFSHQGFVWVTDDKDAGVKGLDLLLATLMGLDADGPAAAPVITLPLEPLVKQYNKNQFSFPSSFCPQTEGQNIARTVFEHLPLLYKEPSKDCF